MLANFFVKFDHLLDRKKFKSDTYSQLSSQLSPPLRAALAKQVPHLHAKNLKEGPPVDPRLSPPDLRPPTTLTCADLLHEQPWQTMLVRTPSLPPPQPAQALARGTLRTKPWYLSEVLSPRSRLTPRSRAPPAPQPPTAEATAVKLKSKQEEIFEVEKEVACRSITVKNMVDDTGMDVPVPLPMVDSKILVCGAARPAQTYPAPALLVRARPGAWVGAT